MPLYTRCTLKIVSYKLLFYHTAQDLEQQLEKTYSDKLELTTKRVYYDRGSIDAVAELIIPYEELEIQKYKVTTNHGHQPKVSITTVWYY